MTCNSYFSSHDIIRSHLLVLSRDIRQGHKIYQLFSTLLNHRDFELLRFHIFVHEVNLKKKEEIQSDS